jgi:hypothetical protein
MKSFLFATLVTFSTVACAKEVPQATPAQPVQVAEAKTEAKTEEKKTKRVCLDKLTKDGKVVMGKDGKPEQVCKDVKIHKKLEGTQVPPK